MKIKGYITEINFQPYVQPLYRRDDDTMKYGYLGKNKIILTIENASHEGVFTFPSKEVEIEIKC